MITNVHRIGDICSIVRGTYPTLKTEPGKYPLVVTAAFRRTASTYQMKGPAVCVPLISSTGHGDAALHRVHYQEGKFALANLLVALIPKDEQICDPKYLYHLLMAKKDEYFVPLMLGTANVSLKEQDIAGVEIALPPLDEQRRVVSRIEELLSKIEEAQRLRQESAEASSAFITSLHAKLSGPNVLRLGQFLQLDERRVPVRPNLSYPQIGIRGFGQGLFARGTIQGTDTTYREFNLLFEGALVMSQVKGWEGAVAMCGTDFAGVYASPEYRTFRCVPEKAIPEYLSVLIRTKWFWSKMTNLTRGVGARRERTRPEAFLEIEIPMPSIQEQRYGLEVFRKIGRLASLQSVTATELDALMPSILSRAFPGEL